MQCILKELRPGASYTVRVRALNRIGAGAWSDALQLHAAAAAPFAPERPEVHVAPVGGSVTVAWRAPCANGSPISEYQLEAAACPAAASAEQLGSRSSSPRASSDPHHNLGNNHLTPRAEHFHVCYAGAATRAEIRHLLPFTRYAFRVCARNAAGTSLFSGAASVRTPPAVPSAPHIESHHATADTIRLHWRPADANGSPVLYYVIEDATPTSTAAAAGASKQQSSQQQQQHRTADGATDWTVRQLRAETQYRYRVQAVNACGPGPFSNTVRVQTRALPPRPPRLECGQPVAHNALKLRWSDGKSADFTRFTLEMWNGRAAEFQSVYDGKLLAFKVGKLQEQQTYAFRICAESDATGVGPWSEVYEFRTAAAVPAAVRAPRCSDAGCMKYGTNADAELMSQGDARSKGASSDWVAAVQVEWLHSRNTFADPVDYVLQMHGPRATEFKQVSNQTD